MTVAFAPTSWNAVLRLAERHPNPYMQASVINAADHLRGRDKLVDATLILNDEESQAPAYEHIDCTDANRGRAAVWYKPINQVPICQVCRDVVVPGVANLRAW